MAFELPKLPYAVDALEPYIDAQTMTIHHDKHHQAYVTNLNGAIEKHPELASKSLDDLLKEASGVNADELPALVGNAEEKIAKLIEAKDLANQDKHGVSLALAVKLDWEAALVWVDERIEYGEARMIALAPTTGILYYVAFVDRGKARRIISLRRDYRREVKHYVQSS